MTNDDLLGHVGGRVRVVREPEILEGILIKRDRLVSVAVGPGRAEHPWQLQTNEGIHWFCIGEQNCRIELL